MNELLPVRLPEDSEDRKERLLDLANKFGTLGEIGYYLNFEYVQHCNKPYRVGTVRLKFDNGIEALFELYPVGINVDITVYIPYYGPPLKLQTQI